MNRFTQAGSALALAAATLFSPTAHADTVSPGYSPNTMSIPGGFSTWGTVSCTLPSGDIVTFDGLTVERWSDAGLLIADLGSIAAPGFAAWILPTPDGSSVVFAHSGDFTGPGGEVYVAPLSGAGATLIAPLVLSYAAAFLPDGNLVATADISGGGNGNDFVRVDLSGKTASVIGHVDGPSGPVAVRANGDVYYATATYDFPPLPGSTDVVYWTAAQVAGGGLDENNWTVWGAGYNAASAMVVDPVKNRVFIAENLYDVNFALLSAEVRRVRPNVSKAELIATATNPLSNLEIVNTGGGAASFQAWQPASGSNLKYNTTDFFSTTDQTRIAPARPQLVATGPGTLGIGSVTLDVAGGPPNGTLFLIFGPQSNMTPNEETYSHPGYLFHTHLSPGSLRRTPFLLPTDASGAGSFTLWNPGTLSGQYGYQFLVGDATGTFLGSTNDVTF